MANITLKGNPINTLGSLPETGTSFKEFDLVAIDLSSKKLSDFAGKRLILNIFPSVDTGTCAASMRRFNQEAAGLDNTVVLCISRDLPFAQKRFCGAEGIENVISLSDFNTGQFGKDNQLEIENGPLAGLHSRCIIVLNESHEVIYTEQVSETIEEPDYVAALAAIS